MGRRIALALAVGAGIAVSGCASHGIHQARTHVSEHGFTVISYPESHRVAFLRRSGDIEHLCAGPGIDVASSSLGGRSVGLLGIAGSKESIGTTHETVETGLGGRDPAVLIARELLFRTCETIMNNELPPEDAVELYKVTLDAIGTIAQNLSDAEGTQATTEQLQFVTPEGSPTFE